MGSEKKPLNPVLGELFYGHWPDQEGRGRTTLTVEQVSHHPPITAYVIENKSKGITLTGHNAQKTSFSSGAIIVKQIGHAILTIDLGEGKKEEVLITLPKLRIDGLWYGSPYIELWDKTNIQSSSGWSSVLEYKGKGYFSGKIHTIKATVSPPGSSSIKHTIEGQWHIQTRDTKTGKVFHGCHLTQGGGHRWTGGGDGGIREQETVGVGRPGYSRRRLRDCVSGEIQD